MEFEWNIKKARINWNKHGISFEEAVSCFYDPFQLSFYDPEHSDDEYREILLAQSEKGKILIIVFTLRDDTIRLISARNATRQEKTYYEKRI
jgi:uncharacterized DUF497 family protein